MSTLYHLSSSSDEDQESSSSDNETGDEDSNSSKSRLGLLSEIPISRSLVSSLPEAPSDTSSRPSLPKILEIGYSCSKFLNQMHNAQQKLSSAVQKRPFEGAMAPLPSKRLKNNNTLHFTQKYIWDQIKQHQLKFKNNSSALMPSNSKNAKMIPQGQEIVESLFSDSTGIVAYLKKGKSLIENGDDPQKDAIDPKSIPSSESTHNSQNSKKLSKKSCKIPNIKKKTFSPSHAGGINAIELFPNTAHLALSSSMDGSVKLWDLYNARECINTYYGHFLSVRDISFNDSGDKFISISFDQTVKIWDIETSKVQHTFTMKSKPFSVLWKENQCIVGTFGKSIQQFDTRHKKPVFQYSEHTGPIRSLKKIHNGEYFASLSADKSVRIWEWGDTISRKTIQNTGSSSFSSPVSLCSHDKSQTFAILDTKGSIQFYSSKTMKPLSQKRLVGVNSSDSYYPIECSFSPDGQYIVSGDAEGKAIFWNLKYKRIVKRMQCHSANSSNKRICNIVRWHPLEPSWVLTGGWNSEIHLWSDH